MTKTKRSARKTSNKNKSKVSIHSSNPKDSQELIDICEHEMKLQLDAYKTHMKHEIAEFKKEMHNVISSIPPEIANMTVEDYIKKYLQNAGEGVPSDPLSEIGNIESTSQPSKTTMPKPSAAVSKPAPSTSRKRGTRKAPVTTRSTRSRKVFDTPAPLVMVEGTPLLTNRSTSHLQLTDKPRRMRENDEISAFKLTMFSSKGSPMMMENVTEEMRRKVQESLHLLMQETTK